MANAIDHFTVVCPLWIKMGEFTLAQLTGEDSAG